MINKFSKGLFIDKIEFLIKLMLMVFYIKMVFLVNFFSKIFIKGIFVYRLIVLRKFWFVSFLFSCLYLKL